MKVSTLVLASFGWSLFCPCLCGDAVDNSEGEDLMWMDDVSLSLVSVVSVLCMLLSGNILFDLKNGRMGGMEGKGREGD